jgi:hypothetical protein
MAPDGPADCYGDWAVVVVGCALVSGLVRAMIVVMLGILDLWGARTRPPVLSWSFRRLVRIR